MRTLTALTILVAFSLAFSGAASDARKLKYNNPGLTVDLGVGLWGYPMPLDYDRDGDTDLLVVSMGKVGSGTYFFENPDGDNPAPVFEPGVRIGPGPSYTSLSFEPDGTPRVFGKNGVEYLNMVESGFDATNPIPIDLQKGFDEIVKTRAQHFGVVDINGDGVLDLFRAVGEWGDYGWDDAYNDSGVWTNGPLKSWIYIMRNQGTNDAPEYGSPTLLSNDDGPLNVYGSPCPNFRDFDQDGDLDLLCGEFVDTLTYFENIGDRTNPEWSEGRKIHNRDGDVYAINLCMFQFVAFDWDNDGDQDLIVAEEDGRVSWMENTGEMPNDRPRFREQVYFQQKAESVKFGVLSTPFVYDWDADGDEDIISGNTAGEIGFIENLGGYPPKWNRPIRMHAAYPPSTPRARPESRRISIQAGDNGSIQGPAERKWGYTTLQVADWNHDRYPDIIVNSILGRVVYFRGFRAPTERRDQLLEPLPVNAVGIPSHHLWPRPKWNWGPDFSLEFETQWRTTPVVTDLNADGLNDLVMLDHEGYLAFFERYRRPSPAGQPRNFAPLDLQPGKRIFYIQSEDEGLVPLRLNDGWAGRSGRRKLAIVDWDGDGRLDLLVNSATANFYRNIGEGFMDFRFRDMGPISEDNIASHSSSPAICDWDQNGVPDLLIGAEDGFFYYYPNDRDFYSRRN